MELRQEPTNAATAHTAVSVRGLAKHYGATRALDGVDLDVAEGTVMGVLGPNGAGKTTLVRILSTLIRPDAGRAVVSGWDVERQPRQLRRAIGLTGQYASVDELLSGYENLYLIGRLLDLSAKGAKARAEELLERFSLTDAARRPARTYSGGMRRRLDLAASMIGRPRVLFLDEPTTGLDPRTRNEVWGEVRQMVGEGSTVLLTTQYMEEAEQLAQDLTVFDHGRVIAAGRVDALKRQVGEQTLTIRPARPEQLDAMVRCLTDRGLAASATADGLVSVPAGDEERMTAVVAALGGSGLGIAGLETRLPSLDEVFLAITGVPADAANQHVSAPTLEPVA
ncbi:daunorubicin resistance protein DrrA family ABC transporter ATP-binding protein [Streptacidiphilus rugosus]|uniref:daunorubicin resistance protein DrrA family ABC transporter ATP-binding protein n=1 Tax=Streptacidiphilus rugosus TaxID=405783 RepID=UPI00055FB008|nr:daunorubicin resistance protein DrrA family ABC transporter ATP-binding protein [Streptacidiphilus rugosus]